MIFFSWTLPSFFWARIVSLARRWCAVQRGSRPFALRLRSSHCPRHTPRHANAIPRSLTSFRKRQTPGHFPFLCSRFIGVDNNSWGVFRFFGRKKVLWRVLGDERLQNHFDDFILNLTHQHVHTGKSKICTARRERPLARTQHECRESAQLGERGLS